MPNNTNLPSQQELRRWLNYDPLTRRFVWREEPRPARPLIGCVAGTMRNGYVMIKIAGYGTFGAHRLAWIYIHGCIKYGLEIDHHDRNPRNNAIDNLRLASSAEQKMNKGVQRNNRSGLKGAFYHAAHKGKKWRSQIKANGQLKFIGYFSTAEEAHQAYKREAEKAFGKFAPLSYESPREGEGPPGKYPQHQPGRVGSPGGPTNPNSPGACPFSPGDGAARSILPSLAIGNRAAPPVSQVPAE